MGELDISFNARNISYRFPSGAYGLRNISISETHGTLVGIMGASGAGKTTLLNILSGLQKPLEGSVRINSTDIYKNTKEVRGITGYIPQDDLLIEELTVFQNLYFSTKLCFRNKTDAEITELVNNCLLSLGLFDYKDLKVGNTFNKLLSGGQRKRLNIALELIREPAILFVDEPTSGLSSRDSENVIDLLKELSEKGKLIFVVIHQPSSGIFKKFDSLVILDQGGYQIFYGSAEEAPRYFKSFVNDKDKEGECPVCGNINPELIFEIIEQREDKTDISKVPKRKREAKDWEKLFHEKIKLKLKSDIDSKLSDLLNIQGWLGQLKVFFKRDVLSKLSNRQYVLLNFFEAPVLGFILSYIIRYIADPNSDAYIFKDNENFPRYIFMAIIFSLFLGLTVSAEEIFRDRKILKREKFLNLSRSAYLLSKVLILTIISALQSFLFVIVGNTVLGVPEMLFEYWFALFSTFILANLIGLNISQSFNSVVTIYILIPFILIPMIALGGAMFSFDKLNRSLGSVGEVPFIAEMMPSRWTYEALMVNQYKNNSLSKQFFEVEKNESDADFKKVYYLPVLNEKLDFVEENLKNKNEDTVRIVENQLKLLKNEINLQKRKVLHIPYNYTGKLERTKLNPHIIEATRDYLKELEKYYSDMLSKAFELNQSYVRFYIENYGFDFYQEQKNKYYNDALREIVKNIYEKNRILIYQNRIVQQIDPIYHDPDDINQNGFRTHFFAPWKVFMGEKIETFWFNMIVLWAISIFLYITLYFKLLVLLIKGTEKIKFLISHRKNEV